MGGLVIKSIQEFNLALLSKWKWIILEDKIAIWKRVLKARYGGIENYVMMENNYKSKSSASFWWKDINNIGALTASFGFYFAGSINFKLGEGILIPSSSTLWCGTSPLENIFHDMFSASRNKDALMENM